MPLTDAEMKEALAMGPAKPAVGLSPAEMAEAKAMGGPEKAPSPSAAARIGTAGLRGIGGGPLGIVSQVGSEAMKIGGEKLDKAAYQAGGKVTDMTGSPAAGFITNVGMQAIPAFIGGGAGGAAGAKAVPAIKNAGSKLMSQALKPGKADRESGDAARAVKTLLEEGANVTPGGVAKLREEISSLNDKIKDAIKNSPGTVDKQAIASRLDKLKDEFLHQATPQADLFIIKKAADDFLNHPLLKQMSDISVQLAQKIKQGTYKALGSKAYGELKGAETEAQKTLARGLKEEIANAVPGIDKLNRRESELLNAETLAISRVMQSANNNAVGIGALATNPKAWLAFAADRSPFIKSLLARATHSSARAAPATGTAVGATAGAAAGAVSGSEPTAADMVGMP